MGTSRILGRATFAFGAVAVALAVTAGDANAQATSGNFGFDTIVSSSPVLCTDVAPADVFGSGCQYGVDSETVWDILLECRGDQTQALTSPRFNCKGLTKGSNSAALPIGAVCGGAKNSQGLFDLSCSYVGVDSETVWDICCY